MMRTERLYAEVAPMSAVMPNLFIVGAPRAATTSLYDYLSSQPDVFMSPLKEPNFFSDQRMERHAYARLFSDADGFAHVGEASTTYLANEAAPERIKRVSPQARIVVSLRDPVERAYSDFLYSVREGLEQRSISFAEAVRAELSCPDTQPGNYLEYSDYLPGLRRYEEHFGRDSMLVVFFEELLNDPDSVLQELLAFLGLDSRRSMNFPHANPHGQPRGILAKHLLLSIRMRVVLGRIVPDPMRRFAHDRLLVKPTPKPELDPDLRAKLISIYRPQVEEIARFVGRRPPWNNFEPASPS
jgi:sulfotransferase family protein